MYKTFYIGGISYMIPRWSCQCSLDFISRDLISVYVRYFQPLWRSWSIIYRHPSWRSQSYVYLHHGDYELSILYVVMTTHVIFCIMPIHGHCTLMYLGLLHLLAVMCRVWSLYCTDWMASSSTGFFITPLLGWTYNVFRPSYDPSDLTHQRESIIADFITHGESHF